jgi:glucosamine--fructose-6-phosphate aminotransferase (isomerizing)
MDSTKQPQAPLPHAMLREIYEQPRAIADTVAHYFKDGRLDPAAFADARNILAGANRIVIAASGSSRHAGLAAEIMLEDIAAIPVDVEYASEYCYRSTKIQEKLTVLVISQSGETADTLTALRQAHARGFKTIAITNVAHSSMAREATVSLPTCAGVEKAVPATKSFTTQLTVLYLLALFLAEQRGKLTAPEIAARVRSLQEIARLMEEWIPRWAAAAAKLAEQYRNARSFLYLGRGVHYPIAREGALKLKESSYLHAEGYPTGELKHGPNALVTLEAPLVVLATRDDDDDESVVRYKKTVSLLEDLRQQDSSVIALANDSDADIVRVSRHVLSIPCAPEHLLPILEVVPLQLFAYSVAVQAGIDVDHPRNLVKAVVRE